MSANEAKFLFRRRFALFFKLACEQNDKQQFAEALESQAAKSLEYLTTNNIHPDEGKEKS